MPIVFCKQWNRALWKIPVLSGGHLLNSHGPLTCVLKCSSMPGSQILRPGSAKYFFGRWKNCNPCCVTVKCSYRSTYILPTTLSHILSDVECWARVLHLSSDIKQTVLSLFILGVENNAISRCSAICVYSNTSMIISVRLQLEWK